MPWLKCGGLTRFTIFAFLSAVVLVVSCTRKHPDQASLSPEESLKSIHVQGDFHVELFASEPLVFDPVEMVFDENGKIYVCEMLDYPDDPPAGKPARSRIVLLEDTDGDGKPDKRTVFADHVLEVSGIMPWKGGLIVTSAPDILYLKDTNGDGVADVRQVLYTGFPKVNPEARVTNPRYGIDNWIYVANDGQDGRITIAGASRAPSGAGARRGFPLSTRARPGGACIRPDAIRHELR